MTPNNSALISGFDDEDPDVHDETPPQPLQVAQGDVQTVSVTQPQDALDKSSRIPPKLVEDVQGNPELLRPVARSMAAVNLHNLFVRIQHPATSNRDRLDFQGVLNKMSGLEAKEVQSNAGAGFSITINIPQVGATGGHTIEAKATVVDEPKLVDVEE